MNSDVLFGALIALISGVVGAFWQAVVSRRSDYIKQGREARYAAYADYFKGIGLLSHGGQSELALALIADSRGRIALYGSKEVVEAMSKVFDNGYDIQSQSAREALSNLLHAMRADVLWVDPAVSKSALTSVVFGTGKA